MRRDKLYRCGNVMEMRGRRKMVDGKYLQIKIVESGLKQADIARALQISEESLQRKINNIGRGFTVAQMQQLVDILHIPIEEAGAIFF